MSLVRHPSTLRTGGGGRGDIAIFGFPFIIGANERCGECAATHILAQGGRAKMEERMSKRIHSTEKLEEEGGPQVAAADLADERPCGGIHQECGRWPPSSSLPRKLPPSSFHRREPCTTRSRRERGGRSIGILVALLGLALPGAALASPPSSSSSSSPLPHPPPMCIGRGISTQGARQVLMVRRGTLLPLRGGSNEGTGTAHKLDRPDSKVVKAAEKVGVFGD
jgi:hypothetical protein